MPEAPEPTLRVIARLHSDFTQKFGIPRQSGLADALQAQVVFERAYRDPDAVRGIEQFSHLWLIWGFSQARREGFSPMVRPPRLGGNTRLGVFATRSPFRPNALGLSCVRLDSLVLDDTLGPVLNVRGADLLDGTPIYDIKPYLPYVDSRPQARGGFTETAKLHALRVDFPPVLLARIPAAKQEALLQVLAQDPRPSYQDDPGRLYGMSFAGFEVKFTVAGDQLCVCDVYPSPSTL